MLHLAYVLVQADLAGGAFGAGEFAVDPAAWQLTGLRADHCLQTRQTAAEQFSAVAESVTNFNYIKALIMTS